MTNDEKQKCAEIWEMISGEKTNITLWNANAGDALAAMVASIISCSKATTYVPKPSGSRPGYGWIVNYVYNVFKQRYNMNKTQIFKGCAAFRFAQWRSVITIELNAG